MNISLVGRQVDLTEAIKDHMNNSLETLNKFNLDIISATAVASKQDTKSKHGVTIELTINLSAKNTVVIKQRDDDLYAAVDIAIDRAQKALRRLHDREVSHHKVGINETKAQNVSSSDVKADAESLDDEIVPVELDLYKPQEVAEVLEGLKEGDKQFEIFLDNEGKTRVLYKRNDGKFGLY